MIWFGMRNRDNEGDDEKWERQHEVDNCECDVGYRCSVLASGIAK